MNDEFGVTLMSLQISKECELEAAFFGGSGSAGGCGDSGGCGSGRRVQRRQWRLQLNKMVPFP